MPAGTDNGITGNSYAVFVDETDELFGIVSGDTVCISIPVKGKAPRNTFFLLQRKETHARHHSQ